MDRGTSPLATITIQLSISYSYNKIPRLSYIDVLQQDPAHGYKLCKPLSLVNSMQALFHTWAAAAQHVDHARGDAPMLASLGIAMASASLGAMLRAAQMLLRDTEPREDDPVLQAVAKACTAVQASPGLVWPTFGPAVEPTEPWSMFVPTSVGIRSMGEPSEYMVAGDDTAELVLCSPIESNRVTIT